MLKDRLTPTQVRLWQLLVEGHRASWHDLAKAIDPDGYCSKKNVRNHIVILRKKLQAGFDIVGERRQNLTTYRLVRLIYDPYED